MSLTFRAILFAFALLLPTACGSRRDPLIVMDAEGSITLNGQPTTLASLATLPALQDPTTPVHIRVSSQAAYVHVDSLQKVLQRLHVERIVFEREK